MSRVIKASQPSSAQAPTNQSRESAPTPAAPCVNFKEQQIEDVVVTLVPETEKKSPSTSEAQVIPFEPSMVMSREIEIAPMTAMRISMPVPLLLGILSYYIECGDTYGGLVHYVLSIDRREHRACIYVRNEVDQFRKIIVHLN